MNKNLIFAQRLLRGALGVSLLLIGLDKVFHTNIFTVWEKYVSPLALSALPFTAVTIVSILGIAEIVLGILYFTRFRRAAAGVTIVALVAIIINLFSLGMYDIALRDFLIGVSAYVFILLTNTVEYQ